ncbi:hypothetical protein V1L54_25755 [Streptomyces sp. TRM 70361]|uniref:hypothetical protein n=1 Tax=Streptomyces sp. TRM 70361 TaxID=3116553 RepID=UPI002E7AFE75|nr:hypothetical protein [Streptomyces sp. TRM 70361]MEE1942773.1 hypothetical protein [Streptomyces sp. TRM 70361]
MAGFNALAEQVRDPDRDPSQRRQALRKCLERFAPYGHRATWHHLCARAGISPDDRRPDPERLVAALEELEEAREVWLAYERAFALRRRRQKYDGIRQPPGADDWHRRSWGGRQLLPVKNPEAAPPAPLAEVLRRLVREAEAREARCAAARAAHEAAGRRPAGRVAVSH